MANVTVAAPGADKSGSDRLKLFLRKFSGEVITAFTQATKTGGRFNARTIENGKSATFPVVGRAKAVYLKAGENLDDKRTNIEHSEKEIFIDGLLTSDCMIADIDEAMIHYDVRSKYTKEIGEALAVAQDCAVIAEVAKMIEANTENIPTKGSVKGTGKGAIITDSLAAEQIGETEAEGVIIFKQLLKIKTLMSKNNVPMSDRNCFIIPEALNALIANKDVINKLYGASMTIEGNEPPKLIGFNLIEMPLLTEGGVDNTNTTQGNGHVFPATYKDTCKFIVAHPSAAGILTLKNLKIEHGRRINYQADQIVASYAKGFGGLRPEAAFMGVITEAA